MAVPGAPDPALVALEVFAGWLSAREAGGATEFADLVRSRPELAGELAALHATWKDLGAGEDLLQLSVAGLSAAGPRASTSDASDVVTRLTLRKTNLSRYTLDREVARGGMGAILRVIDEDFRRPLAMKVALAAVESGAAPGATRMSPKILARFLSEAQITGQLDHPGIVPVHELGLDGDGRLYFTMKLVEGRDLKHVFQLVFEQREGWNLTRALGVLLKACEALAYAHKKGVIHRDLKPANIMVGSFGEVFVMDWGLARVLGSDDPRDIRVAEGDGSLPRTVRTDRSDVLEEAPDSSLLTADGDVLGTPAYMPPEQARGEIEKLTARSDVYSVGAMLYHLLAGQVPYMTRGERPSHREVLARVIAGPPRALTALDARLPAELVAICDKAMGRDPARRYPDTLALAEDLRAYLERRVVAAYETGALAELRKWIARNKSLAAVCAALVLSLAIGLIVSSSLFVKAKQETARADEKAEEAERRTDDVLSLSAIQDLEELVDRADAAWPAHPENIGLYEAWLTEAQMLIDGHAGDPARGIEAEHGLADHRRKLAEIEERGLPRAAAAAESEESGAAPLEWEFESTEDRWWHAQLESLIADLTDFADETTGLMSAGTNPEHGWGIRRRLEFARTIAERSVTGPDAQARWAEAIESIADAAECPLYAGLVLEPQLGLLPIGRDPTCGLWEFADLQTGEPPERDARGELVLDEALGLVFVLVPGGTFRMGVQAADRDQPGWDPHAGSFETSPHLVTLDPFFLSKYEMTQAQWLRFDGTNPSERVPSADFLGKPTTLLNPVEQVTWTECAKVVARLGLALPTEAQWEYAARAGTTSIWFTGDAIESIGGYVNLADDYCRTHGGPGAWLYDEWLDDGYPTTAPVGTYRPNPFGLHDMLGNVWEWCREIFGVYSMPLSPGDGERASENERRHAVRGGSFAEVAISARAATRSAHEPGLRDGGLGLRPSRTIVP